MGLRFLLGLFEAGFGPGVPYLLSFFYLRHELGFRIGFFLAAAPLANSFAGALAYGITSGHPELAKWRLLFLVEGIPTILMAPVAFFFLPDSPDKARFLNEEEKAIARARLVRQVGTPEKRIGGLVWKDVGLTLLDAKAWFTAVCAGRVFFSAFHIDDHIVDVLQLQRIIRKASLPGEAVRRSFQLTARSLPVFLPTILTEMGFSSIDAQGLTCPPYILSFMFTIFTAWVADRTQQRGFMIATLATIGGIGYILLAATTSVGTRYFGVFLAACGVFPAIANILPWVLSTFTPIPLSLCPPQKHDPNPTTTRQPRLRHPPRHRHGNPQRNRPMRAPPRHQHLPGLARPALRRGPIHLRGLHVLHHLSGPDAADSAGVGEQEAGSEAWDAGGAGDETSRGVGGGRAEGELCGRGELWAQVSVCSLMGTGSLLSGG